MNSRIIGNNRTTNVIRGYITESISFVCQTVFPFLLRFAFIKFLGADYLGLNGLCTSILGVLNIVDLGVGAALTAKLYEPLHYKRVDEVNCILRFISKTMNLIGTIIFIVGAIVALFLPKLIEGDTPQSVNYYVVYFIYLMSTCASYWTLSYRKILMDALQRLDVEGVANSIQFLLMYGLEFVMILMRQYYLYLACMLATGVTSALFYLVYLNRYYPQYKPSGNIDAKLSRQYISEVFSVAIYRIRDISRNSFDGMVISATLGLVLLAKYQNYYMILTIPQLLRAVFVEVLKHSFGDYLVEKEREQSYYFFRCIVFALLSISAWCSLCYYFLIDDFVLNWLGSDYIFPKDVTILFAIYVYMLSLVDIFTLARTSAGFWEKGRIPAFVEMVANILLNISLGYFWGISGVLLATIITIVLIYLPFECINVVPGVFGDSWNKCIKILVLNLLWIVVSGSIVGVVISIIPQIHLWRLALEALVCVLVPMVFFVVVNHRLEQYQYFRIKIKLLKKKKGNMK